MKVVIRSSSLLFTLLSIIFHVPIRRIAKPNAMEATPRPESNESGSTNPGRSTESHRETSFVLRGARGNQSF